MTVSVRKYRRGGWEVDIALMLPNGERHRERRKAPGTSRSDAKRWGEQRERHLLVHGRDAFDKEVPTFAVFWPRFLDGHCRANKHKPSGIRSKESAFRNHLEPVLGDRPLDKISAEDVAQLKRRLVERRPSTVNNVLTALSMALKIAVEWGMMRALPTKVRLLRKQKPVPRFYDFDQYRWLLEAADAIDPRVVLVVMLAGDAGLRRGEIIALSQTDCDVRRGEILVERSVWNGHVTETKGMDCRTVPMTRRLRDALAANRHLRGDRVLYTDAGEPATAKVLQKWLARAQRRANLPATGGLHILRHTFCSHLAMKGVPALAIQRLAGHKNMQTTLRYMHLAPGETHRAIRILEGTERPDVAVGHGDIVETDGAAIRKLNE